MSLPKKTQFAATVDPWADREQREAIQVRVDRAWLDACLSAIRAAGRYPNKRWRKLDQRLKFREREVAEARREQGQIDHMMKPHLDAHTARIQIADAEWLRLHPWEGDPDWDGTIP